MPRPDPIFQEYYDKLYATKDYAAEVEIILRLAHDTLGKGKTLERILDIGCGTGGHSLLFAERGYEVVGADIDEYSIDIARHKAAALKNRNLTLLCEAVQGIERFGFDLIVSLFNVVNYIHKVDELLSFFKAIYGRLATPGLYIFDCWNGLAVILDLPREKDTKIMVDDEDIEIRTSPHVDLMEQQVFVDNMVSIRKRDDLKVSFSFQYQHTLWTSFILKELLAMSGFEVLAVFEWMKPVSAATDKSWKIMFMCLKKRVK